MILWTSKPPVKRHAVIALTLSLLTCAVGIAGAQSPVSKMDSFLASSAAHPQQSGWTHVIARFDGPLSTEQKAQMRSLGAGIYRDLSIVHSAAIAVPTRNLVKLAALPFISHVSSDATVKKTDEFTVGSSGAALANSQYRLDGGSGIGVAVIDSGVGQSLLGVQLLPDLALRAPKGRNFVPDSKGHVDPNATDDSCGHGSHVAGIIGGNGLCSTGLLFRRHFVGIAPSADIINVRVLDAQGAGTVSQVIAGVQWAVNNRLAYNIKVMNLSVGHPVGESYKTDPLCQAVEQAWKSGIVVVCAAGNAGRLQDDVDSRLDNEGYGSAYGSIQVPGNDPYVITVGAMKATDMVFNNNGSYTYNRSNDRVATYSSRGPSRVDLVLKPDIAAPGNKVISTTRTWSYLYNYAAGTNQIPWDSILPPLFILPASWQMNLSYFRLSGTSMASPVVAGAAVLMLKNDSTLTPDTIKARLMIAADKWAQPNGMGDPLTFGAGYLNIPAAMACKAVARQPALSPTLAIDADGNVSINMDRAMWGTDISGLRAVWGVNGVNDLRAVWGTRAIWGNSDNLLSASRAIWGNSTMERAVWGTNVWEDRAMWGTYTSAVDLTSIAIQGE